MAAAINLSTLSGTWSEEGQQGRAHFYQQNSPIHAAMELADFDDDGDLDLALGYHTRARSPVGTRWVDIWWNQLKSRTGP
jgi:hypothetical protein